MTQTARAPTLVVATHVVSREQKQIVAAGFDVGPFATLARIYRAR